MSTQSSVDIDRIFDEHVLIDRALHEAYIDAIENHIRYGVPMVFWEDGKVIHMSPEQLPELRLKALERLASMP